MKKLLLILLTLAVCICTCFALVGCGDKFSATLMDGEEQIAVLSTKEDLIARLKKEKADKWFLDKERKTPLDIDNIPNGEFTLYAGYNYNKVDVSFDATLDVGSPVAISADATVYYRETAEGFDLVINNAVANVLGVKYNAQIYYIDGLLKIYASEDKEELELITESAVGTIKDLKEELLEDVKIKAIYDFVVDFMDKNEIELDLDDIKESLLLEPNYNFNNTTEPLDLKDEIQGAIDFLANFLTENKDKVIYDFIVETIVDNQVANGNIPEEQKNGAIQAIKDNVTNFLATLFNDDITVKDFANTILGLISDGLNVDDLFTFIDSLQTAYQVETQDVIDLINVLAEATLPDATDDEQTLTNYFMAQLNALAVQFGKTSILDVKMCDIITMLIGGETPFLFSTNLLPMINGLLTTTTFGGAIDMIVGEATTDMIIDVLSSIDIEKLEFTAEVKANVLGLITKLALGTSDVVSVSETTYSVDIDLSFDFGYNVYGENVFVEPDLQN